MCGATPTRTGRQHLALDVPGAAGAVARNDDSAVPAEWFLKGRAAAGILPRSCGTNISAASPPRRSPAPAATIGQAPRSISRWMRPTRDRQIAMPLLILWGTRGAPPTQEFPTVWRKFASNLVDAQPLPTGHYLQEEAPGPGRRSFPQILHGVNGEANSFTPPPFPLPAGEGNRMWRGEAAPLSPLAWRGSG